MDQPTSFAEKFFYSNYRVVKSEPFNVKVMKGENTNKQTNKPRDHATASSQYKDSETSDQELFAMQKENTD